MEVSNGVSTLPPAETPREQDNSSSVIAVDHSACILCDRCIRACTDVQGNNVIGRGGRGGSARIVFDADSPMGESTCVSCGECMAACPTDALTNKSLTLQIAPGDSKEVDSICPYCGVGCAITYKVAGNTLLSVRGDETSPVNQGRLCVKGRYGFDYAHHPDRLTTPLIRKEGAPKTTELPGDPLSLFREASWDEAMELAASSLGKIHEAHGPSSMAGFGSAKCSNEDNYLFQKLIRAVFGTNNVDHCTRLCHASSVAALSQTIGSSAVSNPFSDALKADFILVAGANATENHPVAATFIKQASNAGATLAVIDPRRIDLVDHADLFVQFRPGTDVALFNGLLNVVIEGKALRRFRRRAHGRFCRTHRKHKALYARKRRQTHRNFGGNAPGTGQRVRDGRAQHDLLGHGPLPAHPRHGQLPRLDRLMSHLRPYRARGNGPTPPARAEQRARRVGRGPHPHGLFRLSGRLLNQNTEKIRRGMGPGTRPKTRLDRHGNRRRRQSGRYKGHVHHGREPGHERPQPQPLKGGARQLRIPRRTGHFPDRNRLFRRRGAPLHRFFRKNGHLYEYRQEGADRKMRHRPARRGAGGLAHRGRTIRAPRLPDGL